MENNKKHTSEIEETSAKRCKVESENELFEICKSLKMSPPIKMNEKYGYHDEYRTLGEIMLQIHKDGFDDSLNDEEKRRALIWLYGRGYLDGLDKEQTRRTTIASILASKDMMERLSTVLGTTGDTVYVTDDDKIYKDWTGLTEDYAFYDGVESLFVDKMTIILRYQLSGNCFVHAPVVMHSYLLQRHLKSFGGAVDITKYVRHYFDEDMLTRLIVHDNGGDSLVILDALTNSTRTETCKSASKNFIKDVIEGFRKHGPGLVRQFVVDETMKKYKQPGKLEIPLFDKYERREVKQRHAMVLVSIRPDESGSGFYFKLQNWWAHMQFLEVTEEFLKASHCRIDFVTQPIEKLIEFPLCRLKVAESHIPEGEDSEDLVYEM